MATAKLSTMAVLPVVLLMRVARRIGLGKRVVRLAFGRMSSQRMKERAFAGYEPTRHDVFVATFGKSGTNWMMQIAQQIAHRGAAEFEHIHDVVPWPDSPAPGLVSLTDPAPRKASPTGLRVVKTHLETEYVPYDEDATYLTVLRDPKEVLVSSYHFLGGMFGVLDHVSISEWLELCLEPGSLATGWAVHTAGFWDWRDRPNVLVMTYREIKREPVRSIERVAAVMGVDLSEGELAEVLERASFAYMSAHESQFAPPRLPLMKESERPLMVRRRASGSSGELLSGAQQDEIDRFCQTELSRLGSDFPYASAFELASEEPSWECPAPRRASLEP